MYRQGVHNAINQVPGNSMGTWALPGGTTTRLYKSLLLHCDTVRFHRDCLTIIITPQTPGRTFTDIRGTSLLSFFDLSRKL